MTFYGQAKYVISNRERSEVLYLRKNTNMDISEIRVAVFPPGCPVSDHQVCQICWGAGVYVTGRCDSNYNPEEIIKETTKKLAKKLAKKKTITLVDLFEGYFDLFNGHN